MQRAWSDTRWRRRSSCPITTWASRPAIRMAISGGAKAATIDTTTPARRHRANSRAAHAAGLQTIVRRAEAAETCARTARRRARWDPEARAVRRIGDRRTPAERRETARYRASRL